MRRWILARRWLRSRGSRARSTSLRWTCRTATPVLCRLIRQKPLRRSVTGTTPRSRSLARCRARSCTTTPSWRWCASSAMECARGHGSSVSCSRITCLPIGLAGPPMQFLSGVDSGALLHALEDKVDTVGALFRQAALPRQDMIFLAYPLFGPLDREPMIAGVGFDPGLVVGGAPAQDLLADRRNTDHVAEEVHHLRGPRQAAEVTVNDNAVKAVVDERQHVAKQLGKQFHGSPPKTRQGSQDHPTWTRPADRRRRGFSSGR